MPKRSTATQVNIHQAKTNLSRLVTRVEAGEEIIIAVGHHQNCHQFFVVFGSAVE